MDKNAHLDLNTFLKEWYEWAVSRRDGYVGHPVFRSDSALCWTYLQWLSYNYTAMYSTRQEFNMFVGIRTDMLNRVLFEKFGTSDFPFNSNNYVYFREERVRNAVHLNELRLDFVRKYLNEQGIGVSATRLASVGEQPKINL